MPIEYWFPTPIYFSYIEEPMLSKIQKDFDYVFSDLKSSGQFIKKEGWGDDKHSLSDTSFKTSIIEKYQLVDFQNEIVKHVQTFLLDPSFNRTTPLNRFKIPEAWMTLTRKGEMAHKHDHGSADLAGVYYYQTNSEDGSIYFDSPNTIVKTNYVLQPIINRVVHNPVVGKLILFPGGLDHGVLPNSTDSERISISFNIYFER